MTSPLPTGSTIGILGGGQLGRMLAVAGSRLGYHTHIFDPSNAPPAAEVATQHHKAAYEDTAALHAFAKAVDVVTYEFENIPTEALDNIEALVPIQPGRKALATSQDRLTEKRFLQGLGLKVAGYADIASPQDLDAALTHPGILKTRRFGYDGKGQVRLGPGDNVAQALEDIAHAPAVFEDLVPFTAEISVIAARGLDGQVVAYDPGQNTHVGGILRETVVPAPVPARLRTDAVLAAGQILNALDYVGVLGVEFFVTSQGLLINEIAPRVHNSGHWTQNGCAVCQFEQHIRAITGLPLGDGQRIANVRMDNLIGDDLDRLPDLLSSGAAIHLYGKSEPRPGRKMGHVNHVTRRAE